MLRVPKDCRIMELWREVHRCRNGLRERIAQLEKALATSDKKGRELEDVLKEERMNVEREEENAKRLEREMRRERELAEERLRITEEKLAVAHELELERKREEYGRELKAMSEAYNKNLAKAKEEIGRVKRERDELVMKVCDFEHNHQLYRRQVFVDAQQKLADSCQKAVTEFSGGTSSDRENISPHHTTAVPSTRAGSAAFVAPTVIVPSFHPHLKRATDMISARKKPFSTNKYLQAAPNAPFRRTENRRKKAGE
ncbi:hypothetical protein Tcan_09888 [Toxocara canis]|uniref:Uncharacterized protein n=1 Tax=Toxocara canis TaxID=6265 RepID=A0A0B2VAX2_TOXCA|nr:hypothetical protein Tcan_09888 [Toxocara canis]